MVFNQLLDWSIVFSFDRSGFQRHVKEKDFKIRSALKPLNAMVTGASKGIGRALSQKLLEWGVSLYTAHRSHPKVPVGTSFQVDMGNLLDVRALVEAKGLPPIDILVHNAGSMPLTQMMSKQGEEEIFASQVIGPYCLTKALIESGKAASGMRTIFVSSGGMYLKKLSFDDLRFEKSSYNRYTAYANAKRAQVILVKILQEKYGNQGFTFSAMHPGWVDTEGVAHSLPWFYRLLRKRFRSPEEGADTILWLAMTEEKYPGGAFWFDRKQTSQHLFHYTKETPEDLEKLAAYCDSFYNAYFS